MTTNNTPPDPAVLRELIERVEAASGRDREIDHAIYEALGKPVVHMDSASTHGTSLVNWAPFYTASLDAAMTLVPSPDWEWSLEVQTGHLYFASEEQMIAIVKMGDPLRGWESVAATPALALCAAALRAHTSTMVENGNG